MLIAPSHAYRELLAGLKAASALGNVYAVQQQAHIPASCVQAAVTCQHKPWLRVRDGKEEKVKRD